MLVGIFTVIGVGSVGLVLLAAILQLLNFIKEKREAEVEKDATPQAYNRRKEIEEEIEKNGFFVIENIIHFNKISIMFNSISEESIELFKKYKSVMNKTLDEYYKDVEKDVEEINKKKTFAVYGNYNVVFLEEELLKRLKTNYRKEVIKKLKTMNDISTTTI